MDILSGLHIAIGTTNHLPDDKRVFHKVAVGLSQYGARVTIISPPGDLPADDKRVKFVFYKKPSGMAGRILAYRHLEKACENVFPDVWIAPEPDSLSVLLKMAQLNNKKVIFDCHEVYSQQLRFYRWLKLISPIVSPLLNYKIKKIASRADGIISVSPGVQLYFRDIKTPQAIIRNCAWKRDYTYEGNNQAYEKKQSEEFVIIQNGTCGELMGTTKLLEAVRLMKHTISVKVKVFESFEPGYENTFRRLLGLMGLTDSVVILPWMKPNEAREHIISSHAGIVLYQGGLAEASLPNKMFDFMAAGIPFVINKNSIYASKMTQNEGCGIAVDGSDAESIASGLTWLAEHSQEAREMGKKGRQAFTNSHNWESELEKLSSFILEIMKNK